MEELKLFVKIMSKKKERTKTAKSKLKKKKLKQVLNRKMGKKEVKHGEIFLNSLI